MIKDVFALIEIANEDLDEATDSFKKGRYRITCFFSQQAAEKYLKAFLLSRKREYPFEHSIAYLIRECEKIDRDFSLLFEIGVHKLGKYYTRTRYLPLLKITKEDAVEALGMAERVRDFVLGKLKVSKR